ncbi:DctP family TRAP transporter solute-binding subunit [Marinomonas mediterranea]|jgi:tripartite ATP-independent periplasmic transporter solute receptor, DctP family|uniref:TRAP dicarboxylate transporter, DctP subunit n=1 Tax=Marinomonas mediterranea (strain ATCC 700492 / JCM 21426 / NBRC 103028 / MMB-1) TaxID=717774 RepID=F2JYZ2_MARM1|nr:DctP family TRAP transporter solute-binding subunit [Marinomonas mediterranea]ADZ90857.1 TRAP dicarboxylate transporter, DctP subunit [Marinomonas mediterranea MMB-1]WCN12939.1 DctP family TRAP transporter solute-binding subunit [Marinomonas mediterranea]WCN17009.1 DctP family TRAP transporter solute-binding subunit [Marinomonas mediterranea MMB-1]
MKTIKSNVFKCIALSAVVLSPLAVEAKSLNIAFTQTMDSQYGAAAKAFQSELDKRSNHEFKVDLKPAGALGGEREVIESLQLGITAMTISSTGPLGNFDKDVYLFDFPYIFKSYDHAHKVLDSSIGQNMLKGLSNHGIKGLAWGENGFRQLTYNGPAILKPSDMDGNKIRTMENKVHLATFKSLGSAPVPMSWTEVFTALQQGTIDGQENPINLAVTSKLYEVQKQASMTQHFYSPAVIAMSQSYWDGLSQQEQQWVQESANVAAKAMRESRAKLEAEAMTELTKQGMTIHTVDIEPFIEATAPIRKKLASDMGFTQQLADIEAMN